MYLLSAYLHHRQVNRAARYNLNALSRGFYNIIVILAMYVLLISGCSKKGSTASPEAFVASLSEAAQKYAGSSNSAGHDAPYKGKHVYWTLEYQGLREGEKGPKLDFNLEPLGIQKKFFDSKHLVMMSFSPEPASIDRWKQVTQGSRVAFDGTVESVLFVKMSPGDMRSISYNVAAASIVGVRPAEPDASR